MDCRIKKINREYFLILDELKKNINNNLDIMPILDEIEIFWLKNRKPTKWREKIEQQVENNQRIQIIDDTDEVEDAD